MLHELDGGQLLKKFPISIPAAAPGNGEQPLTYDVLQGFGVANSILAQKAAWIDKCIVHGLNARR